jgi:hypothetical protein
MTVREGSDRMKEIRDVVIYNEDNSYTEYNGQGVIFTLTMTDGTIAVQIPACQGEIKNMEGNF